MKIETGKFIGNSQDKYIDCGFKPSSFWVVGDSAIPICWYHQAVWCNRANGMLTETTIDKGPRHADTGFYVGSHDSCNKAGVTYYWIAIAEDESGIDFECLNYMGNLTAGRAVVTQKQDTPLAIMIKRDTTEAGLIAVPSLDRSVKTDGTGALGITGASSGLFTVDASPEANKYDGPGGFGEGLQTIVFYAGGGAMVATWVGDGAAGRKLFEAPGKVRGVFSMRTSSTGSSMRTSIDTMPVAGGTKPAGLSGLDNGSLILSGNSGITGASPGAVNGAGITYTAIVLFDTAPKVKHAPAIITKSRRAVWLPGRDIASAIDCGVSDSTLKIDGAQSIEWFGVAYPAYVGGMVDQALIARHGAVSAGTAGSASWGMDIYNTQNGTLHWQSAMIHACVIDRFSSADTLQLASWRTGTLLPYGLPVHLMLTHDGLGKWLLFRNGKLVNQRNIDMTNTAISQGASAIPNIQSAAGHRTVLCGRQGGSGITANLRALFMSARVYNRELSIDDAVRRFEIAALGSAGSDITAGLAEEWSAENAGGTLVPATVNSANNGSINYGSVIKL